MFNGNDVVFLGCMALLMILILILIDNTRE